MTELGSARGVRCEVARTAEPWLLGTPAEDRDPEISRRLRDTVIDSLTTGPAPVTDPGLASRALALDAALAATERPPLRPAETALLRDWLDQLAR